VPIPSTTRYGTSESEHDHCIAAIFCPGCNVMLLCGQAAEEREEKWGVRGGVDRSVRPGRKAA
jgi:Transcription factor WhiB